MTIYIASSWKNQHAVELLTYILEERGSEVKSFVREAAVAENIAKTGGIDAWIGSLDGERKFRFDTTNAMCSDVVIYIGPSGTDAWAEIGAAFARGVPILGLWAKGECSGLMRRMVSKWFDHFEDLISELYGV